MKFIFCIIILYLISSIPNALWIGKVFKDIDIRHKGSGNIGATNASRFLGKKLGLLVLFLDLLKSFLPLYIVKTYIYNGHYLQLAILSFAVILGHSYPIYLGFKGGKSVAVMIGVYIAIMPKIVIFGLIIFVLAIYLLDYVALASIFMSLAYIFFSLAIYYNFYYTSLSICICLFIIYRHQANILRIINNEEPKFSKNH